MTFGDRRTLQIAWVGSWALLFCACGGNRLETPDASLSIPEFGIHEGTPPSADQEASGTLAGQISYPGPDSMLTAELLVSEGFLCSHLGSKWPEYLAQTAAYHHRRVRIERGVPARFEIAFLKAGRPYTVVVAGNHDTCNWAYSCWEGIAPAEAQLETATAEPLNLHFETTLIGCPTGPVLGAITALDGWQGLDGVAAAFEQWSDSEDGLASEILNRLAAKPDEFAAELIAAHRPQLLAAMTAGRPATAGQDGFARAATALSSLRNIELHTLIAIEDGMSEAALVAGDTLSVSHLLSHFTADINGRNERLTISRTRPIFESHSTPSLEAPATLEIENGGSARITEHRMTLPLADAVLSKVLMDQFGDYRLDQIISAMVDCSRAGELVAGTLASSAALSDGFIDPDKGPVVAEMCRTAMGELTEDFRKKVELDVGNLRWDRQVTLKGRASLKLLPEGTMINRLVDGEWAELGPFVARRQ